jgi:hypothetical protein
MKCCACDVRRRHRPLLHPNGADPYEDYRNPPQRPRLFFSDTFTATGYRRGSIRIETEVWGPGEAELSRRGWLALFLYDSHLMKSHATPRVASRASSTLTHCVLGETEDTTMVLSHKDCSSFPTCCCWGGCVCLTVTSIWWC